MNFNGILAKAAKFVWVSGPANYNGGPGTDKWINMKDYDKVLFIIQTGAWAGGTAAVTFNQAKTNAGGSSEAFTNFTHMYTNKAVPSSDLLVDTAVVSGTFNLDTASCLYLVEIRAAELDITNQMDYINCHVATPGGNNDYYSILAIAYGGRFEELLGISAIT